MFDMSGCYVLRRYTALTQLFAMPFCYVMRGYTAVAL